MRVLVGRPVAVTVGVILTVLAGILALTSIPIQLTPDIEVPTLTVTTAWPGASPEEVEREIVQEQEDVLKSLPGLERMMSEARSDQAEVTLELRVGTNLDEALARVTNRLAQVPGYPENARQPVVSTSNNAGPPLAVLTIQATDRGSVARFRTFAENDVVPRLERVPGVGGARLVGGRDQEIEILFDPAALAARGLGVADVARAVRAELRDVSAGDVTLGKRRLLVRTPLAPEDPAELAEIVLATGPDGLSVRLGDVAQVGPGWRKYAGQVLASPAEGFEPQEALAIILSREVGSNVLEVTDGIRAEVDLLQAERMEPLGLELRLVSEQTGYIRGSLRLVRQNILLGGALAVLVLLAFLRSVGASAVIALAIPVCVLATALGMSLMGRTVNVVSLAGMAFAVGMVVDNAIVVLENIDTWRRRGLSAVETAVRGTSEVWGALVASTATTVAVFLPILTWQDEVGELLRDVAAAVSLAVGSSLVVSVLVVPAWSARLRDAGRVGGATDQGPRGLVDGLARRVAGSVAASLGVVGGAVGLAVAVAVWLLPPMEYLPAGSRNFFFGVMVPPAGTSLEELAGVGQRVQEGLLAVRRAPEDRGDLPVGPPLDRSFFVAQPGQAFFGGQAVSDDDILPLVAHARKLAGSVPGMFGIANQASLWGRTLGSGRAVDVDITGTDLQSMTALGGRLMGLIQEVMPGSQVRPLPSLEPGAPEIAVRPRREALRRAGLSTTDLGLTVDALVDGAIIGELGAQGQPNLDVVLRSSNVAWQDPVNLQMAPVATPAGVHPLGALATVEEELGPVLLRRVERRRTITLQVTPPDDLALETALDLMRGRVLAEVAEGLPPDTRIELAGSAGKLEEAQSRLASALLLAVVLCYLLMAALYEDFVAPVVILVTVPLAAAGGVVALRLVDAGLGGQPFDMMTAMGFIMLIGVVVNNAILVVDHALVRLREGVPVADAAADGVRARVRAIAMSACTSLAGLTPMVLMPGSGSELYRGVGAVVLGGLALSTVMTLVVVPALFTLLWRLRGAK